MLAYWNFYSQADEEIVQEDSEGAQAVPEDSGEERGRAAEGEKEMNGGGGAVPRVHGIIEPEDSDDE